MKVTLGTFAETVPKTQNLAISKVTLNQPQVSYVTNVNPKRIKTTANNPFLLFYIIAAICT